MLTRRVGQRCLDDLLFRRNDCRGAGGLDAEGVRCGGRCLFDVRFVRVDEQARPLPLHFAVDVSVPEYRGDVVSKPFFHLGLHFPTFHAHVTVSDQDGVGSRRMHSRA